MAIPFKVNLRGLFVRKISTITTVACLGLVVCVFSALMALASGIHHTFDTSGDPLNVMVMRDGSTSETNSLVTLEQFQTLRTLPGVAKRADGTAIAVGEAVIIVNKDKRGTKDGANIILRGVSPEGFAVHPEVKIVEGRPFQPGKSELIVSRPIAKKFESCGLGETLNLEKRNFQVVGLFEAGGSAHESEIWGDVTEVRETFTRTVYSTVLLRAEDASAVPSIVTAVKEDRRLKLKAMSESLYFADQTKSALPIEAAAFFIAPFLAIGAGFGAANTMYAAVAARSKEIGTLRALGFSRFAILVAYLTEALVLGLVGGIVGTGLTYLVLNGVQTGTINWTTFSEVSFPFRVSPVVISVAIAIASAIGALGGLLPASLAARARITQSIRQI